MFCVYVHDFLVQFLYWKKMYYRYKSGRCSQSQQTVTSIIRRVWSPTSDAISLKTITVPLIRCIFFVYLYIPSRVKNYWRPTANFRALYEIDRTKFRMVGHPVRTRADSPCPPATRRTTSEVTGDTCPSVLVGDTYLRFSSSI